MTLLLDRLVPAVAAPALSPPSLVLNLFDDVELSATWERIEQDALGFTSWIGRVSGDPFSSITLTRLGEGPTLARIAQAVADANTALSRSQLDGTLRLVGIEALPFVESGWIESDLERLASNTAVQQRRDSTGADIVALVVDAPYGSFCGAAFLGPSQSLPFSLVPEPCFNSYSLAHEIGHTFGAGHAPDDAGWGGWRPYSAAYKSSGTLPRFRTVMAYACIASDCPRVLQYSNPQVQFQNSPTGTPAQDNAQTIREAFPLIQAFRATNPSTDPPSAPRDPQASVSTGTVYLSWQPPATGTITNYRVLAGSSSGASNVLNRSVGTLMALTTPAPTGTYYVRIVAENVSGSSPPSEELVITVNGEQTVPGPPRLLAGRAFGNAVDLTWSPPNVGVAPSSYRLEVGSGPGASDLAVFGSSGPYWYRGSVEHGLYYVRVRSQGPGGLSAPSNEVALRVGSAPGCRPPGVPSSLLFTKSGSLITLAWSAPQSGTPPFTYVVEAGSATGSSNLFNGNVGPTTTVSSSVAGGAYFIRVRATNDCGTSAPSNQVVIQVP
ncbi:MAG: fibronectin type III domain-containing protein [Acidobacteria bacterium]|nr:fibronectin type III domain-containing protein [Acidobacteriota bacterium]